MDELRKEYDADRDEMLSLVHSFVEQLRASDLIAG